MPEKRDIFTLRFFDDNKSISPTSFNAKELGQLIISFYEGIKELIDVRHPHIETKELNISLIDIENKSESLTFSNSGPQSINSALKEYGQFISEKKYADLPKLAYKSVKEIYRLTAKKNCNAELIESKGRLFIVTPNDRLIRQEKLLIKSDLLVYGVLIKLGGEKNRAWVDLYDGSKISFPITDQELVVLRSRLKEPVALSGTATWNTLSKKVVYFKLKEIINFQPSTVAEGFENIKKISSGWNNLTDKEIINILKDNS